jgi:hypothetical protein
MHSGEDRFWDIERTNCRRDIPPPGSFKGASHGLYPVRSLRMALLEVRLVTHGVEINKIIHHLIGYH